MNPLRILITNIGIAHCTGTEIVAMDLARAFAKLGHRPMIWAPILRPELVTDLTALGVPVVQDLKDLPASPDIIHGHHHLETIAAIREFAATPAIFVCHSGLGWIDAPLRHPSIRYYVAVDDFCRERLANTSWIPRDRIAVIRNAVDTDRFGSRPPLPPRPRRAAVFSNYAGPGTYLDTVVQVSKQLGIELTVIGEAAGALSTEPESLLPEYDLVFAKARCALEAMAVGCAVILCDTSGLGGMVTSGNLAELRRWNFGFRVLSRRIDAAAIKSEIDRYDANDASRVSARMRSEASLRSAVPQWLALYEQALGTSPLDHPNDYPETSRVQIDDQRHLHLRFVDVPGEARPGTDFAACVALENRSNIALATSPPWPVLLMYRWIDPATGDAVVEHGFRSILQPPSLPGTESQYILRVFAPSKPGRYTLRGTILQENWRWLDMVSPEILCETCVTVRD
jgi:Glycosyltransferase Family 4